MKIVFITNNKHKLERIKDILGKGFEIASLAEIGCHEDIPETGAAPEENTYQKSSCATEHYGRDYFADDTGLEVEALGGGPGAHSARYAKETDRGGEVSMRRLLANLERKTNRKTYLRTIISLIIDGAECQFEGKVEDRIATKNHGTEGLGYDPVFIPEDYDKSFAELDEEIKNQISHHVRVVKKLAGYLGRLKGWKSKKVKGVF